MDRDETLTISELAEKSIKLYIYVHVLVTNNPHLNVIEDIPSFDEAKTFFSIYLDAPEKKLY